MMKFEIVSAILLVVCAEVAIMVGCGATLTPAQAGEVVQYSSQIAHCQAFGKATGQYADYETCVKEGGL